MLSATNEQQIMQTSFIIKSLTLSHLTLWWSDDIAINQLDKYQVFHWSPWSVLISTNIRQLTIKNGKPGSLIFFVYLAEYIIGQNTSQI